MKGMTTKLHLSTIAVSAGLLVASLTAQTGAEPDNTGQMKQKMAQMKDQMKAKMEAKMADGKSEEMSHHSEITQLVDKLVQSFAAVQAEHDPAALAKKLAEHEALLKQLQLNLAEHGKMMAAEDSKAAEADPHAGHH